MSGIIESVAVVLELFVVLISLSNLFDKKVKFDRYMIVLIIVYLFIFTGINSYSFPAYMAFLAYIAIFIYSLFVYKRNIKVTIVNCLLSFAIISVLQLIFYIPVFYFMGVYEKVVSLEELIVNIASVCTVLLIRNKVKLKVISDFILKKSWIMKILFVSIMLYLFVNIFYMKINLSINNEDFIQIIFFIILFFLAINEWQKAIAEAERKKTQLEMNKLYYDAYDELLTLVRERQHDLKNHISAILGMVYTIDNYDELVRSQKEYCNKVMEKSKETKLLLTAGNPLIAGFLYRKIQEAKEKGIDVEYKVIAGSSDFYIPEYELVEMLGILLDNAIEAEEESEITPKEVRVEIGDRKWQFAFLVENTSRVFSQDEIDKFFQKDFTSKGKGHGIGLTKLKKMVHEMDGDLIVTNSERSGINYLQFGVIINKKE